MTRRADLDGASSICVNTHYAPIRYHWYRRVATVRLIDEVSGIVASMAMPEPDKILLVGQFKARMGALVRGELQPRRHIKGPMEEVTKLELFEVRAGVDFGEDSRAELRIYHVEPRSLARKGGSVVVGLHVHEKDLSPGIDINAAQDVELDIAVRRYDDGRKTWWDGAILPSR